MPDGLLLLAFALTLVANAVLIAVAIRALRPGGPMADEPVERSWQTTPRGVASTIANPPAEPTPRPAEPPVATVPADTIVPTTTVEAEVTASPPLASPPQPTTHDAAPRLAKRRRPPARPRDTVAAPKPDSRSPGGRRRKFSLPPLDEDHEKVNRSIESFLSGGDAAGGEAAEPDLLTEPVDREDDQPPTTVALLAVMGPDGRGPEDGSGPDGPANGPRTARAFAGVERALRGAARATDRVERTGRGHFRVVLAATGELAARAYLRRVRATTEPLLDDLDPPRRLAVATATVLDEPIERASEIAERRLSAFIEASRIDDRGGTMEPRAAGD
jgi:hypothetical protein